MYPRSETDPADRWETDPQAAVEAIRQQDWDAFVALLCDQACVCGWPDVVARLSDAMDDTFQPTDRQFETIVRDFARQYDWPSVFRALAQALEADQAARQELDRRR